MDGKLRVAMSLSAHSKRKAHGRQFLWAFLLPKGSVEAMLDFKRGEMVNSLCRMHVAVIRVVQVCYTDMCRVICN